MERFTGMEMLKKYYDSQIAFERHFNLLNSFGVGKQNDHKQQIRFNT